MHTRKQARELLKKANAQAKAGLLDAAAERAALKIEIDAWRGAESERAAMVFEALVRAMRGAKLARKAAMTPEERAAKQARIEARREAEMAAFERQAAEAASIEAILEDVAQRLTGAGLALEHKSEFGSFYFRATDARAGEIVIRIGDHEVPETDERIWAREHGGRRCANREYIVAAAIGEEPAAAERVVAEILDDLRDIE
jgi:hypothetical protein